MDGSSRRLPVRDALTRWNLRPPDAINWCGWTTTLEALEAAGWEVTGQIPYVDWRHARTTMEKSHRFYIRNLKLGMVARVKHEDSRLRESLVLQDRSYAVDHLVIWHVDYLVPEKLRRSKVRVKPVFDDEREIAELSRDDIGQLYELILHLQARPAPPVTTGRVLTLARQLRAS